MTAKSPNPSSAMSCSEKRTALFAGSFNPFTLGHASLVERALPLFDRIVIALGQNADKPSARAEENLAKVKSLYAGEGKVEVLAYQGLTADLARSLGACCLLRGVRSVKDFEAETNLADINRRLCGIETLLLPTLPELAWVSSSLVRELESYGHDTTPFLP